MRTSKQVEFGLEFVHQITKVLESQMVSPNGCL